MNGPANWPTPKNEAATKVGKANPSRNTKPELRLRSALHARGLRFYKHHRVRDGLLRPPEVDIAFTRLKLAVQVHGAFWHGRLQTPKHNNDYWTAKFAYNRERDKVVARRLKKAGWRLVVVWDNWSLERQVKAVARAVEKIGGNVLQHKKVSSKWLRRYMDLAILVGSWSKHPDWRVGAVAVGNFGQIMSTGFNGWPRGMVDEENGRGKTNGNGMSMTIHAESNLVCNANLTGVSLLGSTAFVTLFPCSKCSLLLTQVGIQQVVVPKALPDGLDAKWTSDWKVARAILKDTGVEVTLL